MSKIVIKKKISLDFLGEEYKDGYLVFKSIPLRDFEQYATKAKELEGDEKASSQLIISILQENFITGMFPDEKGDLFEVKKDQLLDFDVATAVKVFSILTGQDQNPKV
jgi:hypothetical protein